MPTPLNAIVVGVPPHGLEAGLDFAVAEALRWSCPLHLVHVLSVPASYAGPRLGPSTRADSTLQATVDRAHALGGDHLEVTTERFDDAWVVDDLVRSGDRGRMVVVEHQPQGPIHRLVLGSTASGVAARAAVPVISVPAGWVPRNTHPPVVTAAVQDAGEAEALLRAAFDEATAQGLGVSVLHAWWLSGYDVVVVDDRMREEYTQRFSAAITPLLDALRLEYPDVPASLTVRHAPPVEAVLDAAQISQLLVLGRRHHLLPLRTHLGPVARATLEHSVAPVMLTPQSAQQPAARRQAVEVDPATPHDHVAATA